jgi:poly-gamma-glutamate capsule biosynthesis protein CapA/YwtB (metallophosphatase superfamily)
MSAKEAESGVLLASNPRFQDIIKNAKAKVDTLVVSFHWGEEYKPHNARQEMLAKKAIDSGARIVVGHHPHVAQDVAVYNGGLIIYSLGNFIFDQYFSKETMQGLGVIVALDGDRIASYNEYTIPLDSRYQPQTPILKK